MFLQAQPLNQALPNSTTLWEVLWAGETITDVFVIMTLIFGALMFYCFFEKYFFLKRISGKSSNFLANIADCIHDNRIESAQDLCIRTPTPESRMVSEGLSRIEKGVAEITTAVKNQKELEVFQMKKNMFRFDTTPFVAIVLGLLGSGVSLVNILLSGSQFLQLPHFYSFLNPLIVGTSLGIIGFFIRLILLSIIQDVALELNAKSKQFLENFNTNS